MSSIASTASEADRARSPLELFLAFSSLSLSGFGGVIPFAYRALVEKRAWLLGPEFAALVGVAQVLPGPTICNMAVMVGFRKGGKSGAIAALLGMVLGPMIIVLMLGVLYEHFGGAPLVQSALRGMSAVAAGLIFATAVKMGITVFVGSKSTPTVRLLMGLWCLIAFVAVGLMHWPLVIVVFALAPLAIATAYWSRS